MKKIYNYILPLLLLVCASRIANAQCTGGTQFPATAGTPGTTFANIATNSYAGEYTTWNVVKGYTYTWSTVVADGAVCSYDSQLTLMNNSGNLLGKYSDDYPGASTSRITWTATYTGVVRVLLNQYNCTTNAINTAVVAKRDAVSASAPTCATIYVSPSGTGNGFDPSTPCSMVTAFGLLGSYSANIKTVKFLNGTYYYYQTLPVFASVFYDGGYESLTDASCSPSTTVWRKSSAQSTILNISPTAMEGTAANPYTRAVLADAISNWGITSMTINLVSTTASSTTANAGAMAAGEKFTPNATNFGQAGATMYGLHIINACTNYTIERCVIATGAAGAGAAGVTPSNGGGLGGVTGVAGTTANNAAGCGTASGGSGATGGTGASGTANTATSGSNGSNGAQGAGAGSAGSCCSAGPGSAGGSGGGGGTGGAWTVGIRPTASTTNTTLFVPSQAASGGSGGGGGGGGNGGGSRRGTNCICSNTSSNPTSGTGGAGGTGGTGGTGGYGGGSTFGIFRFGTETGVNINDVTLTTGPVGTGGNGAAGSAGLGGNAGGGGAGWSPCASFTAPSGGAGGTGGAGGRGQDGATGISAQMVIAGAVSSPSAAIPNAQTITTDQRDGCTNSMITITKASGTFTLPTGATIVNDVTSSTGSTDVNSNAALITFAAAPSPTNQSLVVTGTGAGTWRNFVQINNTRTLPTIAPLASNVCLGNTISFTSSIAGAACYEWTVQLTPVTGLNLPAAVFTSTAQNTANYTTAAVGTYQVRFRVKDNCCGWSVPVYTTFTVIPLHAIALTSANNTQTVCPNSAIANITCTVSGGATGATVSGLPSGVTGALSGTTFTLSGTPTVSGTYNYTLTTTGNACTAATATGTITVRNLLAYVVLQAPASGTICPSQTHTVYGQTYAAGVTEAPGAGAGITAQLGYSTTNTDPSTWTNWQTTTFNVQVGNNDEYQSTFSGLTAGTYYYAYRYNLNGCQWQYAGTGGAWTAGTSGVLTVNPNHALALTSAGTTTTQTVCPNAAIANITYSVTAGGTSAGVTGLPSGVNGSYSGGVFTISGTPTVSGTYNYTITTTGNACTAATATGTITARNLFTFFNLQFPSSGAICPSGTFTVYGQTYAAGVTEAAGAGAGIVAELGYNNANTDPSTWTTWQAATFNVQSGNNDEFQSTLSGLSAGTYYYAYRYRLNGCQNQYGGTSGAWTTGTSGVLTVNPNHTIALTSANDTQTKCVSQQAITNISYTVGGGGTGAGVTGLPTGLSGAFSGGIFTISGTPTAAGTFNYTVITTGNACTAATATGTITVNALPTAGITNNTGTTVLTCTTTSISLTATGGTSYAWSGGSPTNAATTSVTAPNTYTVTVTDANTCFSTIPITITQNIATPTPSSAAQTNVSCNGSTNGSITISGGSSTTPYSICAGTGCTSFGTAQTSGTFGSLAQGDYVVNVTGANGCTSTLSVSITEPTALSGSASASAILCNNGTTTLTVTASGGTGSLQYSKDAGTNYQGGNTFTVAAGSYTVWVKDANNCTANLGTTSIANPTAVSFTATSTNADCNGGTGSILVTAAGGAGAYQYQIAGGGFVAQSNPHTFTSLVANSYNVQVQDANGCTAAVQGISVTQPSAITIGSVSSTSPTCNGFTNGNISFSASGGTGTLTYSITGTGGTFQASGVFNTLAAGSYTLVAKDAAGCFSLTQNLNLTAPALITFTASTNNVTCSTGTNGSINIAASGGSGIYDYSSNNGVSYSSTSPIANLTAGTYSVITKDNAGCLSTVQNITISEPSVIVANISGTTPICNGQSTTLTAIATGGTGAFSYNWAVLGANAAQTVSPSTTMTYTVTATDANFCTKTATFEVVVNALPTLSVTNINNVCPAVTAVLATAVTTNGTPTFFTNAACTAAVPDPTMAGAGTYYVKTTSAAACTASTSFDVAILTCCSNPVFDTPLVIDITCLVSGSISLTQTSGSAPTSYAWTGTPQTTEDISSLAAGTYTVTATTSGGCSAVVTATVGTNTAAPAITVSNNGPLTCTQTSVILSPTGTGASYAFSGGSATVFTPNTYTVTATYANGCTTTASTVLTQNIALPIIGISGTSALTCATTALTLTATGNGASFVWSNGTATAASGTISATGIYTVTATGANGCLATATKNITQNITNPIINIAGRNSFCMSGNTTLMASPGFAMYAWSNGASTRQVVLNAAGTYTVSVTAINGCTSTKTIVITQNTLPSLSIATLAPVCVGTPMNIVAAVGGTPAATSVNWTGPNGFAQSTTVVGGSATLTRSMTSAIAGTYMARATNACGIRNTSTSVQSRNLIPVTIAIQNATVLGGGTGSITVTAASGSTFAWSGASGTISVPSTQNYLRNVVAGTYMVVVSPPVGSTACTVTRVIVIN